MHKTSAYVLVIIIISQFAGTSLWFASNAVLPELQNVFHLDKHAVSSITSAVQLGFICGTLVFAILSIADRFSPSKVFFISSIIAAIANLGVIYTNAVGIMITLRFATGFFLAGIYPVGMKIAADWFDKELGRALGYLVGALVLGTAFPHLLKGGYFSLPWKEVLVVTSAFAALGGILILAFVSDGPYRRKAQAMKPSAMFEVFRVKNFRSAAFGYFGHMWELYTFWAFLPFIVSLHNQATKPINISLTSFISIAAGAVGCIVGGWLSRTLGSARVAFYSLSISGLCCLLSPFMIFSATALFFLYLVIWGISVAADSPQFSTLVAATASPEQKGTALTFVVSIGFAITIVSIFLMDQLTQRLNPNNLFTILSIGPALGLVSMFPLIRKSNP